MKAAIVLMCLIASSLLMFVSVAMNWRFGLTLGRTELDSQIYGLASIGADCLKAFSPFLIAWGWRNKHYIGSFFATIILFVTMSYSITSSVGFASLNRAQIVGERQSNHEKYNALKKEKEALVKSSHKLGETLPVNEVKSRLRALEQNKRWSSSKECTNSTVQASREFCKKYFSLEAELGRSKEKQKIDLRLSELNKEVKASPTILQSADPQALELSNLTGAKIEVVKTSLIVLVALLVELGSTFGFYISLNHGEVKRKKKEERANTKEATGQLVEIHDTTQKESIETYVFERVFQEQGVYITFPEIYGDYASWCASHNIRESSYGAFQGAFTTLSKDVGIPNKMTDEGVLIFANIRLGRPDLRMTELKVIDVAS